MEDDENLVPLDAYCHILELLRKLKITNDAIKGDKIAREVWKAIEQSKRSCL